MVIRVSGNIARVMGAVGVTCALVGLGSMSDSVALAGTSPICTRGMTTVEVDPRGLLPLKANPIAPATTAALRYTNPAGNPQVISADLATVDRQRGGEAAYECGTRVWRRTVVVYITLRAFKNSASLSEGVFFVGRLKTGYRVWQVVH